MQQKPEILENLQLLVDYIQKNGRKYGSDKKYFKSEGDAQRIYLPFYFVEGNFGVRLYCIRVKEDIVILLNGDRKTAQKAQDCPNCFPHFKFANRVADAFWKAVDDEFLEFEGKEIIFKYDDFELEI